MRDGIEVFKLARNPEDGTERKETLGTSPKAGQMAVMQSAASRVMTNMSVDGHSPNTDSRPTLVIPPLLMTFLQKRGAFNGPRGGLKANVANLTFSQSDIVLGLVS